MSIGGIAAGGMIGPVSHECMNGEGRSMDGWNDVACETGCGTGVSRIFVDDGAFVSLALSCQNDENFASREQVAN